mmetsp:Transcript_127434/g.220432  ORF Transcript_127434/g.220432 Transcript_127434/m.220432 type:complete len:80 (+) Transcript_127434:285-524(+)
MFKRRARAGRAPGNLLGISTEHSFLPLSLQKQAVDVPRLTSPLKKQKMHWLPRVLRDAETKAILQQKEEDHQRQSGPLK